MPEKPPQLDNSIQVITPENIAFEYQAAGPFRRLPAFLIDVFIRITAFVIIFLLIGLVGAFSAVFGQIMADLADYMIAFTIFAWFVSQWLYGGLFETFMNGQTPGKWACGLRVVTPDGEPINGMQAFMRTFLRSVDMMPVLPLASLALFIQRMNGIPAEEFWDLPLDAMVAIYIFPTGMLGLITMSLSRQHQRLGDFVCHTMVVVDTKRWSTELARLEDHRTAHLAAILPARVEVSRSLAKALSTYVERRQQFSVARRAEIASHLARPLLVEFGLPSDTSYDLLLCALYYKQFIAEHGEDLPSLNAQMQGSSNVSSYNNPPHPRYRSEDTIHIRPGR